VDTACTARTCTTCTCTHAARALTPNRGSSSRRRRRGRARGGIRPRNRNRNSRATCSRQRRERRTQARIPRTRPRAIQILVQGSRRPTDPLPLNAEIEEVHLDRIAVGILFIAPFAEVVEPCGGIRRVGGDEGAVCGGGGRVGVVVGGEGGVPEGTLGGVIVDNDGGNGAGVGSWDGEVGVAADGAIDEGS
jgi:hypothetical protein